MDNNFEYFEVTQKALLVRNNKILVALDTAANKWDLPGGRIDKGEKDADSAFAREVLEELGIEKFEKIDIADREIFINKRGNPSCAIGILIKNDDDELIISDEHLEFKWINENEIKNYEFTHPQIVALVKAGFKYLNKYGK